MISSVDGEARKRANLRLLQRLDRWTVDIVGQATHVVLYEFREQEQRWDKLNVEGSLFVTQRGDAPRFKLFVLNRNSTRNLEVGVTPDFQMQLREPYLIFRDGDGDGDPANAATIRGLWFHDGDERIRVSRLLEDTVKTLTREPEGVTRAGVGGSSEPPTSRADAGAAAAALLAPLTMTAAATSESSRRGGDVAPARSTRPTTAEHAKPPPPSSTTTAPPPQTSSSSLPSQSNLVLDKKSLQLSLLSLIQDDRFLDLIHAQYLKVAHARVNRNKNETRNTTG